MTWTSCLAIAFGGALGALFRFALLSLHVHAQPHATFPWATLGANVIGSAILGVLWSMKETWPANLWAFGAIGFCGALTTFSTFIFDLKILLSGQKLLTALGYLGISLVMAMLAFLLGARLPKT